MEGAANPRISSSANAGVTAMRVMEMYRGMIKCNIVTAEVEVMVEYL